MSQNQSHPPATKGVGLLGIKVLPKGRREHSEVHKLHPGNAIHCFLCLLHWSGSGWDSQWLKVVAIWWLIHDLCHVPFGKVPVCQKHYSELYLVLFCAITLPQAAQQLSAWFTRRPTAGRETQLPSGEQNASTFSGLTPANRNALWPRPLLNLFCCRPLSQECV